MNIRHDHVSYIMKSLKKRVDNKCGNIANVRALNALNIVTMFTVFAYRMIELFWMGLSKNCGAIIFQIASDSFYNGYPHCESYWRYW